MLRRALPLLSILSGAQAGWLLSMLLVKPAFVLCFLSSFNGLRAESYDRIGRNSRVVDCSGNPAFFADVGVKDGRVPAIGRLDAKAKTEIDAKGLIVAPGFIDVHT